jgi:hypothetical protein
MSTQQGFNQGTLIPHEAETARQIYLQVLNQLLSRKCDQKHGSNYRTLPSNPYEYGGHQNPYIWIKVTKTQYEQFQKNVYWYTTGQLHDPDLHIEETDQGWDNALHEAYDLDSRKCDLDEYYEVEITTYNGDLQDLLTKIKNQTNKTQNTTN